MEKFIKTKSFDLVCYGCGDRFDLEKFNLVKNRDDHAKPSGGLWTSPVDSAWGWRDWCKAEGFGDLSSRFELRFFGRVFVIDSIEAAKALPWKELDRPSAYPRPNWDAIAGVDAVHMTVNGEQATRYEQPSFYGWDCETVLIFNPKCITEVESRKTVIL